MNQQNQVFPQGRKVIALTAGQLLAVAAATPCQVFQQVGYPNQPISESLVGTVNGGETTFTPAGGAAATYVLYAGASGAQYAVGTSPRNMQQAAAALQGAPGVLNATGTLTAAMILAGLVTSTAGAAVVATLDTGAVMDAATDMAIGESFEWGVIVTGANTFTVTSPGASHTLVGNAVVPANGTGRWRTRKTAAATYISYAIPQPIS